FKPKDIISGDFYWTAQTKENELIIAAVDCTGHGVPGAFLTIVGNSILNQIVNFDQITNPSEILTKMNQRILERFQTNSNQEINDGMDISICKIAKTSVGHNVQFAGAYTPVYYIRNNEVIEVKGSRNAIGTPLSESPVYEGREFDLYENDMLYLFSDGYVDQLGGDKGKKFMRRRFKNVLINIHNKPAIEQEKELIVNFDKWRGEIRQIDDVLVIGIKF
ncbi:MAG: SpoIIE family protein phosphatase, partial [Flavobacteriales bacterium]|nr:SpoIIE family protein phosphatase [Flavobacteriales bacterium]